MKDSTGPAQATTTRACPITEVNLAESKISATSMLGIGTPFTKSRLFCTCWSLVSSRPAMAQLKFLVIFGGCCAMNCETYFPVKPFC